MRAPLLSPSPPASPPPPTSFTWVLPGSRVPGTDTVAILGQLPPLESWCIECQKPLPCVYPAPYQLLGWGSYFLLLYGGLLVGMFWGTVWAEPDERILPLGRDQWTIPPAPPVGPDVIPPAPPFVPDPDPFSTILWEFFQDQPVVPFFLFLGLLFLRSWRLRLRRLQPTVPMPPGEKKQRKYW